MANRTKSSPPAQRARRPRLSSGIEGLDAVLCEGFPEGGVYLIVGQPGTGKTTLVSQMCFTAARDGLRSVFVTLLSESHTRLLVNLEPFQFFHDALLGSGVRFVSGFATLVERGLDGILELIRQEVKQRRARILVIDGFVALDQVGRSALEIKRFVHELQIQAELTGVTVFATTSQAVETMQPERTMVDGIIELRTTRKDEHVSRVLEVHKLRGSRYLAGGHTFRISDDGLDVEPRLETMLSTPSKEDTCIAVKTTIGVPKLDAILGGGLACGTTTMILGPSGSGKTTLGLHFLCASTPEDPGVFFGVYETPPRLEHKANEIGLDLGKLTASGAVRVLWRPMTDATLDGLGHSILKEVQRSRAKRLMIDGLDGFRRAADHPDRIPSFFTALANELRVRGVTTVYTTETPALVGPNVELPLTGVSALVENLIFMRFVELEANLHRLISVLKVRDTNYDSHVYEFRISASGIDLAPTFVSAENVLSGFARRSFPSRGSTSAESHTPPVAPVRRRHDQQGRPRRR